MIIKAKQSDEILVDTDVNYVGKVSKYTEIYQRWINAALLTEWENPPNNLIMRLFLPSN